MENKFSRGRPRDPERMKRVLEAAARQFVRLGFAKASIDAIAKESGVSKVTIYSYFPSKEALFEAVVNTYTDAVFGSLPQGLPDPHRPEQVLTIIGKAFLTLNRSDDVVGTFRLMFSAAGQHVEACEAFYRKGPEKLIILVSEYLRAADAVGSLCVASPMVAADQFLSLFMGGGSHTRHAWIR